MIRYIIDKGVDLHSNIKRYDDTNVNYTVSKKILHFVKTNKMGGKIHEKKLK